METTAPAACDGEPIAYVASPMASTNLYIYFNNDAFGHAVRNAMTLTDLIATASTRSTVVAE